MRLCRLWFFALGKASGGLKSGLQHRLLLLLRRLYNHLGRQRFSVDQHSHFVGIENLAFQKRFGDSLQLVAIVREYRFGLGVTLIYNPLYLLVNADGRFLAKITVLSDFTA